MHKRSSTSTLLRPAALAASGAVAALLAATIFAQAADLTPQEKALIPLAKKEGAVTIINPLFSDRTAQLMGAAFIKRYNLGPDFKFNNLRKGTGATIAQVTQEIKAGKFTVDVHMVSDPGFFGAAVKRGAFDKLDSGYWKDSEAVAKSAGQYFDYPYVVTPLAYSFQPVWNSACPGMKDVNVTSIYDTVKPEFKGKTISSDITKSSTYTNTTISLIENKAVDFKKLYTMLKATDPLVEFRTEPKMQMLITCQRAMDMFNLGGRVYQNVQKKAELAKVLKVGYFKEGQVMLGNQMAVLKGAPHPNAGKLLIEFLLSKEGADVYVEGEAIYSFRKGYQPPAVAKPYLLDLEKVKLLGLKDWVAARAKFKAVRDEWQSYFQ